MLSSQDIEDLLSPMGALTEPAPLLEWQRGLYPPGPAPMRTGFRTVDGVRIRYAESARACERTLVLTSPWPESVYAFAPIWPLLRRRFHLLALDLPGFGASEHRDDLLAPRAMSEFLLRVIHDFGLDRVHLVGPDIGTATALFAAASCPQLIASVIVGSGGASVPVQLEQPLCDSALAPEMNSIDALDSRAAVGAALDLIEGPLPLGIRADYLDSYTGDRFVDSIHYVRRYPQQLPALARLLPKIDTPVLIVAGDRDPVVPAANGEFLERRLPHSRLVTVDAGHFVWEDAPDRYASLLINWVMNGYRTIRGQR
jgi:pimeloyl-ACP methyl ester carboxylesterase